MKIDCETPLREIYPGSLEVELALRSGEQTLRAAGWVTTIFRAFDGRVGVQFEGEETGALPDVSLIPLAFIEGYRILETDWDIEREGDRAAFEDLYEEEIEYLLSDKHSGGDDGARSWADIVNEERLSRLAPRHREWHRNNEMVIYLTLAASISEEVEGDLATRVGGALWACVRTSNAERVRLAGELAGLRVDDARFIEAAAATCPHDVARVASSAMFVGLGGRKGTAETLRLLTLLQAHAQTPRFF